MTQLFLSKLRLQQFRSFASFDLDLPAEPGVLIVQGTNGLGKSSLFDGIEWALTDKIDHFRNARGKEKAGAYLCRWRNGVAGETFAELGFSDGSLIKRSLASEKAAASLLHGDIASATDIVELLRAPAWTQPIGSLDHYLLLTHFLGQSVLSRLTHRDPSDRFEILREAAQSQSIQEIGTALHGHGSSTPAKTYGRQIAERQREADALGMELGQEETLWAESRLAGAISDGDAATELTVIAERLQRKAETDPQAVTSIDDLQMLIEGIAAGARAVEGQAAGARLLLAERERTTSQKLATDAAINALERQRLTHQSELAAAQARQSVAQVRVADHQATMSAAVARSAQLHALAANIARRDDTAQQLSTNEDQAAAVATQCSAEERLIGRVQRQLQIVSRLEADIAALDDRVERQRRVTLTVELIIDAETRIAQLRLAEIALDRDHPDLADALALREAEAIDAETRAHSHLQLLASLRDTVGAMSAAVSSVAVNLPNDACDCPVCATHFPDAAALRERADEAAGRLAPLLIEQERLAVDAAASRDDIVAERDRLRAIAAQLHHLRVSIEDAKTQRTAMLTAVDSQDLAAFSAVHLRAQTVDLIDELLRRRGRKLYWIGHPLLGGGNRTATLSRAMRERDTAVRARDSMLRDGAALRGQLDLVQKDIAAACGALGLNAPPSPTALEEDLTHRQAAIDSVRVALAAAQTEHGEIEDEIRRLTVSLETIAVEFQSVKTARSDHISTLDRVAEDWRGLRLFGETPGADVVAAAENRVVRTHGALAEASTALTGLRERRVAWGRQLTHRAVLEQLRQRIDAAPNSDRYGIRKSAADKQARLLQQVAAIERAQGIAKKASAEISSRLAEFNSEYIKPLGDLMKQINLAILSDRSVGIDLKVKNKRVEQRALLKDLDPILVHSEGQLAALAVSMLCAASLTFPWSRWNALVLDDPLQSNDTIHAAAFADLISNLVNGQHYQVMISTHLQSQAEFLDRKFRANGVRCTTVSLLGIGKDGVEYDVRGNEAGIARQRSA